MIKKELVSIVKALLPRQDKTGKYHDEVVATAIGMVYARAVNAAYKSTGKELDNYVKTYGVSTALTVLEEAATGIYYTTLPVHYVPLPDKASGIRRVDAVIQGGNKFYPLLAHEADLILNGSFFNIHPSKTGYVVKGGRVEYVNITDTSALLTSGVRMDIVTEFTDLEDDDTVYVPHGQEDAFIKATLEVLGVIPPVDLSDTNADPKVKQ